MKYALHVIAERLLYLIKEQVLDSMIRLACLAYLTEGPALNKKRDSHKTGRLLRQMIHPKRSGCEIVSASSTRLQFMICPTYREMPGFHEMPDTP